MASVWVARQTGKHGFRRLVAMKTILPKYAAEPKFQRMFIDEARIASRIEHANVTQILDVGEQHDVTYLVMEYVDGDALSKIHRAAQEQGRRDSRSGSCSASWRTCAAGCTPPTSSGTTRERRSASCTATSRRRTSSSRHEAWQSSSTSGSPRRATGSRATRTATRSRARCSTCRPSKRSACRSTGAPTCGPSARSSTTSSRGAPRSRRTTRSRRSLTITSGRRPSPLPSDVPAPVRDAGRACARALGRGALRDGGGAPAGDRGCDCRVQAGRQHVGRRGVHRGRPRRPGGEAEGGLALGLKAADEREKIDAIMRSNAEPTAPARSGGREATGLTQADTARRPAVISRSPSRRRRRRDRPSARRPWPFRPPIEHGAGPSWWRRVAWSSAGRSRCSPCDRRAKGPRPRRPCRRRPRWRRRALPLAPRLRRLLPSPPRSLLPPRRRVHPRARAPSSSTSATRTPRAPAASSGGAPCSRRQTRSHTHGHRQAPGELWVLDSGSGAACWPSMLIASVARADPTAVDRETARTLMDQGRELERKGRHRRRR